jgi:hypothetical protein
VGGWCVGLGVGGGVGSVRFLSVSGRVGGVPSPGSR